MTISRNIQAAKDRRSCGISLFDSDYKYCMIDFHDELGRRSLTCHEIKNLKNEFKVKCRVGNTYDKYYIAYCKEIDELLQQCTCKNGSI
jgi:hypothetical protein